VWIAYWRGGVDELDALGGAMESVARVAIGRRLRPDGHRDLSLAPGRLWVVGADQGVDGIDGAPVGLDGSLHSFGLVDD
jgi:hypothetical protein